MVKEFFRKTKAGMPHFASIEFELLLEMFYTLAIHNKF